MTTEMGKDVIQVATAGLSIDQPEFKTIDFINEIFPNGSWFRDANGFMLHPQAPNPR